MLSQREAIFRQNKGKSLRLTIGSHRSEEVTRQKNSANEAKVYSRWQVRYPLYIQNGRMMRRTEAWIHGMSLVCRHARRAHPDLLIYRARRLAMVSTLGVVTWLYKSGDHDVTITSSHRHKSK